MNKARMTIEINSAANTGIENALRVLKAGIESVGAQNRWNDTQIYRVNLVLEELITNTLSYGTEQSEEKTNIIVAIDCQNGEIDIEISDNGTAFDPMNEAPVAPMHERGQSEIQIGGLGLHIVRSMTHTMVYNREEGRNRLTLKINGRH